MWVTSFFHKPATSHLPTGVTAAKAALFVVTTEARRRCGTGRAAMDTPFDPQPPTLQRVGCSTRASSMMRRCYEKDDVAKVARTAIPAFMHKRPMDVDFHLPRTAVRSRLPNS